MSLPEFDRSFDNRSRKRTRELLHRYTALLEPLPRLAGLPTRRWPAWLRHRLGPPSAGAGDDAESRLRRFLMLFQEELNEVTAAAREDRWRPLEDASLGEATFLAARLLATLLSTRVEDLEDLLPARIRAAAGRRAQ